MIQIKDKSLCSGCTACKSICPKNCISMCEDKEGFLYPKVDISVCINCCLCEKVCPIINQIEEKLESTQKGFIVSHTDDNIRKESTSGGAFTAIAEWVLNKQGVVFGAAFDEDLVVRHQYVENKEELSKFRNSKYVQSEMGDSLVLVKRFLEQERWVCFSGTPCQIEGCYTFLNRAYERLVLVDVMCRAVPSPKVLRMYLKNQADKYGRIEKCFFRDKSIYGYKYSQLVLKNGRGDVLYHNGIDTDKWLRIFFSGIANRPSCYHCKFRKRYRVSDFTLWDCFEPGKYSKELDDNKGATRVLVHSVKGLNILASIKKMRMVEIDPNILIGSFKQVSSSIPLNNKRERFLDDLDLFDFRYVAKKYFPNTLSVFIERSLRKIACKWGIYKIVRSVFKKLFGEKKR